MKKTLARLFGRHTSIRSEPAICQKLPTGPTYINFSPALCVRENIYFDDPFQWEAINITKIESEVNLTQCQISASKRMNTISVKKS